MQPAGNLTEIITENMDLTGFQSGFIRSGFSPKGVTEDNGWRLKAVELLF